MFTGDCLPGQNMCIVQHVGSSYPTHGASSSKRNFLENVILRSFEKMFFFCREINKFILPFVLFLPRRRKGGIGLTAAILGQSMLAQSFTVGSVAFAEISTAPNELGLLYFHSHSTFKKKSLLRYTSRLAPDHTKRTLTAQRPATNWSPPENKPREPNKPSYANKQIKTRKRTK